MHAHIFHACNCTCSLSIFRHKSGLVLIKSLFHICCPFSHGVFNRNCSLSTQNPAFYNHVVYNPRWSWFDQEYRLLAFSLPDKGNEPVDNPLGVFLLLDPLWRHNWSFPPYLTALNNAVDNKTIFDIIYKIKWKINHDTYIQYGIILKRKSISFYCRFCVNNAF